ncbi:nucleoside monophosphate kinase, partial [Nocardioides sp.]|uniref:nucleoside monophosphate kinase n=1 Tax=Nocardioides sp. TaxID=35761 RepID=UPI002735C8B8
MNNNIAVIFYGPPGSGKGTQAKLLSDKLNLYLFDTGDFLRKIFSNPKLKNNKKIQAQKKLYNEGKLVSFEWVLKNVSQKVKELAKLDQSIVFSGSARSLFEAFGDNKHKGLVKILEEIFGKHNLYFFYLDILDKESIKRNS